MMRTTVFGHFGGNSAIFREVAVAPVFSTSERGEKREKGTNFCFGLVSPTASCQRDFRSLSPASSVSSPHTGAVFVQRHRLYQTNVNFVLVNVNLLMLLFKYSWLLLWVNK